MKMNDIDTLEDIIESLAALRLYQKKDSDMVGVELTTELIKKIKEYLTQ